MSPIDLYVISGFLGAGKTTFLQRVLEATKSYRVGVIVNEFGALGMDGHCLRTEGVELVELNNGSIFCACMKDKFTAALQAFSRENIDMLFIENSGMADPGSFSNVLRGIAPYLERAYRYLGSACLVDCTTFLDYFYTLQPVKNQTGTADVVILNKVDLAELDDLNEIRHCIREVNPKAKQIETNFAQIPMDAFLHNMVYLHREAVSTNMPWNRPYSKVLDMESVEHLTCLPAFLTALGVFTARVKGYVRQGDGYLHVDCVSTAVHISPAKHGEFSGLGAGKLVVIGCDETDLTQRIGAVWNQYYSCDLNMVDA